MKNTAKGALAAGSAAVLLIGGAGTLAFWSATDDADPGSVTNGYLTLDSGACDADWVHTKANGAALPANAVGDVVTTIVPGDVITKDCTFVVGAQGDNLSATPTLPTSVAFTETPANTSFDATVAATYALTTVGANGVTTPLAGAITEANDGQTLTATIEVTIPYGTAEGAPTPANTNDTQRLVAALDDLAVTLTQDTF